MQNAKSSHNSHSSKKSKKNIHFFNPVTGQKMDINENEEDLSKEINELILEDHDKIKNVILYQDCPDLKEKEIEFFVLWNNFKDSHKLNEKYDVYDTIEKFVDMFIHENIERIQKNGLINELILFLTYLLDIGEISFTFFYLWTNKISLSY